MHELHSKDQDLSAELGLGWMALCQWWTGGDSGRPHRFLGASPGVWEGATFSGLTGKHRYRAGLSQLLEHRTQGKAAWMHTRANQRPQPWRRAWCLAGATVGIGLIRQTALRPENPYSSRRDIARLRYSQNYNFSFGVSASPLG